MQVCHPSLYSSLLFLITNRSNLHTDRRSPTKWKDPHCNIVGRIPLGYLCQCRAGSRCFGEQLLPFHLWGQIPYRDRLAGAVRAMCAASSSQPCTTAPAIKHSCCCFGISHSSVLLNSLSPAPVVLISPIFLGSTVCSTGHLPIQDHCDNLHNSHTDPRQAMAPSSGAWPLQCFLFF